MTEPESDRVPVFGRWRGWYTLLLLALLAELSFFLFLTWYFR